MKTNKPKVCYERKKLEEVYNRLQPVWDYMIETKRGVKYPDEYGEVDLRVRDLELKGFQAHQPPLAYDLPGLHVQLTNREAVISYDLNWWIVDTKGIGTEDLLRKGYGYFPLGKYEKMFRGVNLSNKGLGTLFAYRFDKRNKLPQVHSWRYGRNMHVGMLHGGCMLTHWRPELANKILQWESEDKPPRFEDSGWLERLLEKVNELKQTRRRS